MNDLSIEYLYFYRTPAGTLTKSTAPCDGEGLVEITKVEYDRQLRSMEQSHADLVEVARVDREAKRAALAAKLGIDVEDLELLH